MAQHTRVALGWVTGYSTADTVLEILESTGLADSFCVEDEHSECQTPGYTHRYRVYASSSSEMDEVTHAELSGMVRGVEATFRSLQAAELI